MNQSMKTYINAHPEMWSYGAIGIRIADYNPHTNEVSIIKDIVREVYKADDPALNMDNGPTLTIDREAAQKLLDDLYNAGLRPTVVRHDEGLIEALKAHVGDFRKLIFKREGIES